jgi:hypothetical protein
VRAVVCPPDTAVIVNSVSPLYSVWAGTSCRHTPSDDTLVWRRGSPAMDGAEMLMTTVWSGVPHLKRFGD